ncbi:epidermal growth factor receptor substrate 15 isoform X2 [Rhinatrema bivittatum]|uniref:epidermal growth factor receptor substrate 15 isoform X2 n=1 Tax=Rhinatrema bivittatum TaxID=194408 RepID=UPI00112BE673|nr:epidermal growth factor receptor substrate 15 isoform X2 [Rhinatrema bivittatum]
MAAKFSLTQLSSGNPLYEKYYRQVDSGNTGKVLASDAALFLKTSRLTDLILGKIWDLADTDAKGYLNKQEFYVALRLVACAQNGLDVSLNSLNLVVPPPRFHDTGSPLLVGGTVGPDIPWAVKLEEKAKYDVIFDSLNPVNGLLSGEKVKPVLLNSKLPVDVLGRVWELSDIDHDGLLDRDEFAVAMFLVYCALEKEPVPMSLPPALVPPSKRKSFSVPGTAHVIPPIPSPPSVKEPHQSLPPVGILPTKASATQWIVSPAEKAKCDEIFMKTDKDMDGYVSGLEVREIFLKTGLPSTVLAQIWALCDTKDCGKLSKEQFALAFHFINQKLTKGIDPPQVLTTEMIPPSDRAALHKNSLGPSPVADFSAIKELDTLNNEIADLQREKTNVEQDLNEREEAIKRRTSEVQDLQDEVERENSNLEKLQVQKQEVQEIFEGLEKQKVKLEEQLHDIRQKCAEECQLISSLKAEVTSQELKISTYEVELTKAKEELSRLQQETAELEEYVKEGKMQLAPLEQHLLDSQQEINSVQAKLFDLKVVENHNGHQYDWNSHQQSTLVNGAADYSSLSNSSSETANLNENAESQNQAEPEPVNIESPVRSSPDVSQTAVNEIDEEDLDAAVIEKAEHPFDTKLNPLPNPVTEPTLDFFQSDPFVDGDPFKDDPFGKTDPFGSDPFKGSDPFASDSFFKQLSTDPFAATGTDPFSTTMASSNVLATEALKNDPFAPGGTVIAAVNKSETDDPFATVFGSDSFGSGFADFSVLSEANTADPFTSATPGSVSNEFSSKNVFEEEQAKTEDVPPALPPKTGTPTRPCPPPPGKRSTVNKLESSEFSKRSDPFQPSLPSSTVHMDAEVDLFSDPFAPTTSSKEASEKGDFANFSSTSFQAARSSASCKNQRSSM